MLLAAAVAGQNPLGPPSESPHATVYRDVNGMPHIVADNEASAWYALGYEQARDGLLWIQVVCKGAKGEATWAGGFGGLTSDFAVKVFKTHERLALLLDPARRALFAPTNPNIPANFYDNCVAFAAGADAYRQAVQNAPPTPLTPELQLRNWLDNHAVPGGLGQPDFKWVYQDTIEAVDIAAQGAAVAAGMSFMWPSGLVNSAGASYGNLPGGGDPAEDEEPVGDPLAPGNVQRWLDQWRQRLSVLPGAASAFAGSNTFAWSRLYCQDASPGTTTYAGLLGDPHQGAPLLGDFERVPNHIWFAHVKVTPPGASQPSLDVLGHCPYGSATFFTSHNRYVARGGTLGAPNYLDTFLLRLREGTGGLPAAPPNYEFYSYYHDSPPPATSNATWRPITGPHMAAVKRWDGQTISVPYWRADSFGIILPNYEDALGVLFGGGQPPSPPVVYGERIDPNQPAPRWRVGVPPNPERMRFWSAPQFDSSQQLLTSPMVVALRAPIDPAVAGEDKHLLLMRDLWEMAHATQVDDVIDKTNGAAFLANVCFVDRSGRTFSTVLSAIPERGDNNPQTWLNKQYRTLDKWAIYSKAFGPVPARHYDDRMFDWRFGSYLPADRPTDLSYLQYPTANPPTGPFKAMTLQDQLANTALPPTSFPATGKFRIESGFFASACNDMIWGFSRKRDSLQWNPGPGAGPFNNVTVADNQLFQWALDRGVVHQTPLIGLEAPNTQQIVVSRLTEQAERIIRGAPAGLPPLTPAQMREFVVTPELYHDDSYAPPTGMTSNSTLPTPIRQLKEVVDNQSYSAVIGNKLYESPLVTAQKELWFFDDLWTHLFGGTWNSHVVVGASPPVTLKLRDLWVNHGEPAFQDKIFWYDDPTNPTNPGLRWIDMPPHFPLIDFFWPESEVSDGVTAGTLNSNGVNGLLSNEQQKLGTLVTALVSWDAAGPHYRNVPTSTGACLLEMMRMRYNAQTIPPPDPNPGDFGRHWVRLKRGEVQYGGSWSPLTSSGQLPGGAGLVKQNRPWLPLRELAFPFSQVATLFEAGAQVPYDALYTNPVMRQVRTTLAPEHTNALVAFFLQLGNHYIDPQFNNGNPSRKLARFQLLNPQTAEAVFLARLPPTYPLTDGLRRLTAVRALLDTNAYLLSISPLGIPRYDQCFRSRAYDHTGQIWPALPAADNDCVGGSLRGVAWNEAPDPGRVHWRGFQPKFLGLGGSLATLLALFPSVGQGVDSYFWCTPGIELMNFSPTGQARFDAHMTAFTTNALLPTHYDDFLNHVAWSVVHTY